MPPTRAHVHVEMTTTTKQNSADYTQTDAHELPPSSTLDNDNQSSAVDLEKIDATPEEPVRNVHGLKVHESLGFPDS
jgi:hypothetical protein